MALMEIMYAVGDESIDGPSGRGGASAGLLGQGDRREVAGNSDDILDPQGIPVDDDFGGHAAECQRE